MYSERPNFDELDLEMNQLGEEQVTLLENRCMFTGMAAAHLINYANRNPHEIEAKQCRKTAEFLFSIHDKATEDLSGYGYTNEVKAHRIVQIVAAHHQAMNGDYEASEDFEDYGDDD